MKNTRIKRAVIWQMLVFIGLFFCLNSESWAQSESTNKEKSVSISTTPEGKVKLKVVTKEGNDSKTFEKTYDSYDEIQNDPDLKTHGIDLDGFGIGNRSFSFGTQGQSKWADDNNNFFMFDFGTDSLVQKMDKFMQRGFGGNSFFFNFDDDAFMMGMDSLTRNYNFNFGNGKMFFNDQEFFDIDSLTKSMKEQFGNLSFDFDFDSNGFRNFNGSDDDIKVISRARVIVRSAKDKDREIAGTDKMEDLEIKDISFYPNPSDGRFNLEVETTNNGPIQVKIISPTGEVVYEHTETSGQRNYDFKIDISDQEEGIYILKVIQNNKALTKRIVIE